MSFQLMMYMVLLRLITISKRSSWAKRPWEELHLVRASLWSNILSYLLRIASVAKLREEREMPPLQCFVIDVISMTSSNLDAEDMEMLRQQKMSSTYIREWLAQNRTKSSQEWREKRRMRNSYHMQLFCNSKGDVDTSSSSPKIVVTSDFW